MEIENIDVLKLTPKIRYLDDMRKVLYDKDFAKTAPNTELYYMYGNLMEDGNLRYSITVVVPKILGKEFNKTKGHVHIGNYKETYTVLEGNAIYLMQKSKKDCADKIEDVYAVMARQGESIMIPSGYGHVTINASKKSLKTGDWRNVACQQDYSLFEKFQGACYWCILLPSGQAGWQKNPNYKSVPNLRFEKPLKSLDNLDFLR